MLYGYGKLNEKQVIEFQNNYNIILPNDYKQYLQENNGGSVNNQNICFNAKNISELISVDVLYGINHEKSSLSLETWNKEYEYDLLEDMIIIGHAKGSGLILLSNQKGRKGIYFWDNCLDYEESTEEECIYFIADTFNGFLSNLFLYED